MKEKLLLFLFILVLTCGCTSMMLQNPTLQDLDGTWEATGPIFYYRLSINKKGNGQLAIVIDENNIKHYSINSFQSEKESFKISFVDKKGKENPILLRGRIIMGRLVLNSVSEPNEKLWFIRSSDLSKYRKVAKENIQSRQKP